MLTAKLFQNGRSQAVRLPKEFRFPGGQVFVQKFGNGVLLLPEQGRWDMLFEACGKFSPDLFAEGREQDIPQERPSIG